MSQQGHRQHGERDFRWRVNEKGDIHFLDKKWTNTGIIVGGLHILLLVRAIGP